jgi:hypothetical protein
MFKYTQECKQIYDDLRSDGALYEVAQFESIIDRIVMFGLKYNGLYHKFSFVSDNPSFLSKMKVKSLLDIEDITYFQHTRFMSNNDQWIYSECCAWSLYSEY